MSALPPEADMFIVGINVCCVPIADISNASTGGSASKRKKGFPAAVCRFMKSMDCVDLGADFRQRVA